MSGYGQGTSVPTARYGGSDCDPYAFAEVNHEDDVLVLGRTRRYVPNEWDEPTSAEAWVERIRAERGL